MKINFEISHVDNQQYERILDQSQMAHHSIVVNRTNVHVQLQDSKMRKYKIKLYMILNDWYDMVIMTEVGMGYEITNILLNFYYSFA